MKHLMLALALGFVSVALSAPAMATSIDRTPVVATLTGSLEKIKTVALLADGRLQIVGENGKIGVVQVSKKALARLVDEAYALKGAKIIESHSSVVCMVMPRPSLDTLSVSGYDQQTGKFDSKLVRVLTPDGCEVSDKAAPEQLYALKSAVSLRAQLLILTLNSLKK